MYNSIDSYKSFVRSSNVLKISENVISKIYCDLWCDLWIGFLKKLLRSCRPSPPSAYNYEWLTNRFLFFTFILLNVLSFFNGLLHYFDFCFIEKIQSFYKFFMRFQKIPFFGVIGVHSKPVPTRKRFFGQICRKDIQFYRNENKFSWNQP